MWGRHVEHELHEATKKAKNDNQAQQKAMMVMRRLMSPPEEEKESEAPAKTAKFKDPAAIMKKG